MQPDRLRMFIYFERYDRRTSGLVRVGEPHEMLPHPSQERSAARGLARSQGD
jgi:hypothetical protein